LPRAPTEIFLIAMLVIYAAPYLVWRIFRTDFWAPLVVVQIIGGILLGPGVLGAFFPDYYKTVFTPGTITALNGIAWWAVMMFVWVAGIELDIREAWRRRGETGLTAGLALAVPLVTGSFAALLMLRYPGWRGEAGATWQVVLGIGIACAVTALPILVLFLEKLSILRTAFGQRILRYASLDDVAFWQSSCSTGNAWGGSSGFWSSSDSRHWRFVRSWRVCRSRIAGIWVSSGWQDVVLRLTGRGCTSW